MKINKYFYVFVLASILSSSYIYSSKMHKGKTLEIGSQFYTQASPTIHDYCKVDGLFSKTSILLLQKENAENENIGKSKLIYTHKKKEGYIETLIIHPQHRNLGLGSHVFKCAIAHLYKSFDCSEINFLAKPLSNPTQKRLAQLVAFYERLGAVVSDFQLPDDGDAPSTFMYYPLKRAALISALLPILEPYPFSKYERVHNINRKQYAISPHSTINTIIDYMDLKEDVPL